MSKKLMNAAENEGQNAEVRIKEGDAGRIPRGVKAFGECKAKEHCAAPFSGSGPKGMPGSLMRRDYLHLNLVCGAGQWRTAACFTVCPVIQGEPPINSYIDSVRLI
jgi:hypothetical protein